jgi:stage IV sporulation protein FB
MAFIIAHELGHVATASILGAGTYCFKVLPVGVNAAIDDSRCGKWGRILIYISGPLVNLLFAAIMLTMYANWFFNIELRSGVYVNLSLAFFNLLPILPLDGGRLVIELFSDRYGLFSTAGKMRILSITAAFMCIIIILLRKNLFNLSLILVGIYIILNSLESKKETALMNIKNILFRRARIIRKGIFPVQQIVVMKNVRLSEAIKAMDHVNKYHLINVLDEDLRIVKVMTEQEVFDAIMLHNANATFDILLEKSH